MNNYIYIGQYKCPLLYNTFVHGWHKHKNAKEFLPDLDGSSMWLDGHWFVHKKDWETARSLAAKAIEEQDDSFFERFYTLAEKETSKMLEASEKIHTSKEVTPEIIEEFFYTMQDMEFPWVLSIPFDEAAESAVKQFSQIFTIPSKPTLLTKQRLSLHELNKTIKDANINISNKSIDALNSIKSNPKIYNLLKQHVEENQWLGMMHFWGSPLTEEKLVEQLQNIKESETIDFSEKIEWLKRHTAELAYFRNHFAETCSVASYKGLAALEKASKQLGLSWNQAAWLTPTEFLAGIKGQPIPKLSEIEKRKESFGLIHKGNKSIIITGTQLQSLISQLVPSSSSNNLKGMVVSKGFAEGIAKLVLSPDDINKVNKGDIVIANETTPDFLPALHKAAAIVTNMGGLTSHAAIVAREFKIPCIVGTRHATSAFSDGDFVRVDTEKESILKLPQPSPHSSASQ